MKVLYQKQMEKKKKILFFPVEMDREKEYEVENILNKRDVKGEVFDQVEDIYNRRKYVRKIGELRNYNRISRRI